MTLMPVSNIFSSVDWSSSVGGGAVNRPALLRLHGPIGKVDRLAEHVQHSAERFWADRHGDRLAEIVAFMPRCMPSVGFIATARTRFSPRCCSTSAITSIASAALAVGLDAERVVDRRQMPGLELDVDDGADDLNDLADLADCSCDRHASRALLRPKRLR